MSNLPFRSLEPTVFVSAQIGPETVSRLRERGFALLVNHRPDGEAPDQPTSAEMADAAAAAGLGYVHAPVRGLPDADALAATADALGRAADDGKVLMFCRSGLRSSACWALVRRMDGADPEALRAAAADAGYDLSALPL